MAAAAAGKHVYCEKPLARTVVEARRMLAAVEAAGVTAQMSFNFRFFPAITRARQLVEEGFLGRVFSFRARYYRASYIDAGRPLSWRLSREQAGGGALHDLGSHVLDLVSCLLGRFGAVQALLETLIPRRPVAAGSGEQAAVEVDDLALLHVRMASGVPGLVEISRMGTGAVNDIQLELYGDRGALRFRGEEPSWLEVYDATEPDQPLGGRRGFRRLETVQHHAGQVAPDWSQAAGFARSHAECQYRFCARCGRGGQETPTWAPGCTCRRQWRLPCGHPPRGAGWSWRSWPPARHERADIPRVTGGIRCHGLNPGDMRN